MKTNDFTLSFQELKSSVLLFISMWRYDTSVFKKRDPLGGYTIDDAVYKSICERDGIRNIEEYGELLGLLRPMILPLDKKYLFSFIDLRTMRLMTLVMPTARPSKQLLYFTHEDISGHPGEPSFRCLIDTYKGVTTMLGIGDICTLSEPNDGSLQTHFYHAKSCYVAQTPLKQPINLSHFGSFINDEDHGIHSLIK